MKATLTFYINDLEAEQLREYYRNHTIVLHDRYEDWGLVPDEMIIEDDSAEPVDKTS